jgi:DNA-binding transcriptional MerR regulator
MSGRLRSGELARLSGVSSDTLRHYERVGVLPRPRRAPNGYRQYDGGALERVGLVRQALAMGFTLEELARVLAARASGKPPCREVRRLAGEKLKELEERLVELARLGEELRRTIHDWDQRLAATPEGEPARLLETLGRKSPRSVESRPFRFRKGKKR